MTEFENIALAYYDQTHNETVNINKGIDRISKGIDSIEVSSKKIVNTISEFVGTQERYLSRIIQVLISTGNNRSGGNRSGGNRSGGNRSDGIRGGMMDPGMMGGMMEPGMMGGMGSGMMGGMMDPAMMGGMSGMGDGMNIKILRNIEVSNQEIVDIISEFVEIQDSNLDEIKELLINVEESINNKMDSEDADDFDLIGESFDEEGRLKKIQVSNQKILDTISSFVRIQETHLGEISKSLTSINTAFTNGDLVSNWMESESDGEINADSEKISKILIQVGDNTRKSLKALRYVIDFASKVNESDADKAAKSIHSFFNGIFGEGNSDWIDQFKKFQGTADDFANTMQKMALGVVLFTGGLLSYYYAAQLMGGAAGLLLYTTSLVSSIYLLSTIGKWVDDMKETGELLVMLGASSLLIAASTYVLASVSEDVGVEPFIWLFGVLSATVSMALLISSIDNLMKDTAEVIALIGVSLIGFATTTYIISSIQSSVDMTNVVSFLAITTAITGMFSFIQKFEESAQESAKTLGLIGLASLSFVGVLVALDLSVSSIQTSNIFGLLGIITGAVGVMWMISKIKGDIKEGATALSILGVSMLAFTGSFALSTQILNYVDEDQILNMLFVVGAASALMFVLGKAKGDLIKGALSLAIMSGSLFLFTYSFVKSAEMLDNIAFGYDSENNILGAGLKIFAVVGASAGSMFVIGKFFGNIALGAATLALMGISMWVFAEGMAQIEEISTKIWNKSSSLDENSALAITAVITASAGMMAALGGATGASFGLIPLGIATMLGMGVALKQFAIGMQEVESITLSEPEFNKIKRLLISSGELVTAFSGSGGAGEYVSRFFGVSDIDMGLKMLRTLGTSLTGIVEGLVQASNVTISKDQWDDVQSLIGKSMGLLKPSKDDKSDYADKFWGLFGESDTDNQIQKFESLASGLTGIVEGLMKAGEIENPEKAVKKARILIEGMMDAMGKIMNSEEFAESLEGGVFSDGVLVNLNDFLMDFSESAGEINSFDGTLQLTGIKSEIDSLVGLNDPLDEFNLTLERTAETFELIADSIADIDLDQLNSVINKLNSIETNSVDINTNNNNQTPNTNDVSKSADMSALIESQQSMVEILQAMATSLKENNNATNTSNRKLDAAIQALGELQPQY